MKSEPVAVERKPYRPYGACDLLWRCRKKEILLDGPAGTGKTRGVLEKVVCALLKYPGARALISRKIRADMSETVLVTLEEKVLPDWPCWGEIKRTSRSSYSFTNGSELVVAGWDKPGKILSGEYDIIVVHQAEELDEDSWQTALTRLRNNVMPYQQAIAECNPSAPRHWLLERAEKRLMHRIIARHTDNPIYFDQTTGEITDVGEAYIYETLGKLTGHQRARLLEGKWVTATGLVYAQYDEVVHRVRSAARFERFVIGIDDGYTNPLSAHLYGIDGDGRVHSCREFYKKQQLPESVLAWAKRLRKTVDVYGRLAGNDAEIEAVVIDPSAAKLIAAFEDEDFPVMAADNAVSDGIKTVAEYLKINGDNRPRFTLDPQCVSQHKEFFAYMWAKNRAGESKDVPVKQNDHAMDELRYVLRYCEQTDASFEVT